MLQISLLILSFGLFLSQPVFAVSERVFVKSDLDHTGTIFSNYVRKTKMEAKILAYQEPKFDRYVGGGWARFDTSKVRDNIHVSLLAKAYADFAQRTSAHSGFLRMNPSGYVGSMGEFTNNFSQALKPHLQIPCEFKLLVQKGFSQPLARFNTDKLDADKLGWSQARAWEQLAAYYLQAFKRHQ